MAGALAAQTAPATPAGHWEGTLEIPDQAMAVTIDLAKTDKGDWNGSFGAPEKGIKGFKLDKIAIDGTSVKFNVIGLPGNPEFTGTLKPEGKLSLAGAMVGASIPLEMKRTGEAKIEEAKREPAVDAKLEGDWEGNIDTPGGSIRVVMHFHNQPDKTVVAMADSPDQGANGLPLSDIVVKDSVVTLKLRLVDGEFKGSFNPAATEIRGDWTQHGESMPLTLKKSAAK